jgi:hypothetical protein
MVANATIEDALYDWVHAVLPTVVIIWNHQNVPRPVVPYLDLHLSPISSVGVDAVLPPDPVHGISEIVGNRDFTLSIQCLGPLASDYAETLRISLEKPSVQFNLRQKGVVFVDRLANVSISEVVDNRWEHRHLLDLKFRYAQYDTDFVGTIDHADIEKDFFSPDLNTITVEHIIF